MSSPTQCIISELEFRFTDLPSIKNSVQTSEGEIVRIDKAIWVVSPVLRNHLLNGDSYKVLSASKDCLKALCEAFKDGKLPPDLPSSLKLLAVASELELQSLTTVCFKALHEMKAFYELDYPAECSTETVMRCFRVFLDTPLRTVEIYEQQLNRIARHCSNDRDVMLNAINLMKQMLEQYVQSDLEGIPVGFNRRMVTVVIFKRSGKRQTAIIDGGELRPVNLLGKHFNLDAVEVEDLFYLNYGSYLLFKSGESVYYKNLRADSEPIEELNGCTIMVTRAKFVFAVRSEGECSSIFLWANDEEFVRIYQSTAKIRMLEYEYNAGLLVVLLGNSQLLLFRLEHHTLLLVHESCVPGLQNVLFSGDNMFYVLENDGELTVESHRTPIIGDGAVDRSADATSDDKNTPQNYGNCTGADEIHSSCGDEFYLLEDGRLEILQNFPSPHQRRALLTKDELCSISQLWLLS